MTNSLKLSGEHGERLRLDRPAPPGGCSHLLLPCPQHGLRPRGPSQVAGICKKALRFLRRPGKGASLRLVFRRRRAGRAGGHSLQLPSRLAAGCIP